MRVRPSHHRMMRCYRTSALLCLFLGHYAPDELSAQERFYRVFEAEEGLNPAAVRALAQDSIGFLWIGTEGGLFRYDGVEMRRWTPELLDRTIDGIIVSPSGVVVVLREGGALFTITADGVVAVRDSGGLPIIDARDAAFDTRGQLWIIQNHELWRRDGHGGWSRISWALGERERPTYIRPGRNGAVLLATTGGAWRITPPRRERLLAFDDIVDLHATDDGRVLVLGFLGELFEVTSTGSREVLHAAGLKLGRGISIAVRGSVVWVALDRYLISWQRDNPPEVLGAESGIQSGGPLLIDHEGSLWMGSFTGLYQFSEPETRIWTERSGLPSNHSRYLARTGDTVWITTWQGAGSVRWHEGKWSASSESQWSSYTRLNVDRRGVLWVGSDQGILEIAAGRVVRRHHSGPVGVFGFQESPEGEIWLGTSQGLFRRDPFLGSLVSIPVPAFQENQPVETVLVDRRGDLWASSNEVVCRAPRVDVRTGRRANWSCTRIPGAVHLTGLVEMSSGTIWASTNRLGILKGDGRSWTPLPGLQTLPSRSILSLVPARSRGAWVVGHGVLHRLSEVPEAHPPWRVEEHLSHWHGLPTGSATHLMEDSDGGIWVATSRGVAQVPAEARFTTPHPPRVVVVDARVDGERIPLPSSLELPHDRNRLELRFAALSYRDPSFVRYQVRLSENDPWVTTSGEASFRWVSLSAGRYRAQVRASLDGKTWSPTPAAFSFRVSPPWYRQPWAIALYASAIALVFYVAHRLRVAYLLRLERQRTRIAMDLHDEIGSGLGSIGILSGMLTSGQVAQSDHGEMARQIGGTAHELGSALSHIVWTLDPRSRTLEEIGARLAEHARRLFGNGATEMTTRFPTPWPMVHPAPLIRRNVLLIGLEALHNAARHANARNVELAFTPTPDGSWQMTVTDDGRGLPGDPATTSPGGLGLRSMRRRAEEMGEEIHWSATAGGGTKVTLTFRLRRSGWHVID